MAGAKEAHRSLYSRSSNGLESSHPLASSMNFCSPLAMQGPSSTAPGSQWGIRGSLTTQSLPMPLVPVRGTHPNSVSRAWLPISNSSMPSCVTFGPELLSGHSTVLWSLSAHEPITLLTNFLPQRTTCLSIPRTLSDMSLDSLRTP